MSTQDFSWLNPEPKKQSGKQDFSWLDPTEPEPAQPETPAVKPDAVLSKLEGMQMKQPEPSEQPMAAEAPYSTPGMLLPGGNQATPPVDLWKTLGNPGRPNLEQYGERLYTQTESASALQHLTMGVRSMGIGLAQAFSDTVTGGLSLILPSADPYAEQAKNVLQDPNSSPEQAQKAQDVLEAVQVEQAAIAKLEEVLKQVKDPEDRAQIEHELKQSRKRLGYFTEPAPALDNMDIESDVTSLAAGVRSMFTGRTWDEEKVHMQRTLDEGRARMPELRFTEKVGESAGYMLNFMAGSSAALIGKVSASTQKLLLAAKAPRWLIGAGGMGAGFFVEGLARSGGDVDVATHALLMAPFVRIAGGLGDRAGRLLQLGSENPGVVAQFWNRVAYGLGRATVEGAAFAAGGDAAGALALLLKGQGWTQAELREAMPNLMLAHEYFEANAAVRSAQSAEELAAAHRRLKQAQANVADAAANILGTSLVLGTHGMLRQSEVPAYRRRNPVETEKALRSYIEAHIDYRVDPKTAGGKKAAKDLTAQRKNLKQWFDGVKAEAVEMPSDSAAKRWEFRGKKLTPLQALEVMKTASRYLKRIGMQPVGEPGFFRKPGWPKLRIITSADAIEVTIGKDTYRNGEAVTQLADYIAEATAANMKARQLLRLQGVSETGQPGVHAIRTQQHDGFVTIGRDGKPLYREKGSGDWTEWKPREAAQKPPRGPQPAKAPKPKKETKPKAPAPAKPSAPETTKEPATPVEAPKPQVSPGHPDFVGPPQKGEPIGPPQRVDQYEEPVGPPQRVEAYDDPIGPQVGPTHPLFIGPAPADGAQEQPMIQVDGTLKQRIEQAIGGIVRAGQASPRGIPIGIAEGIQSIERWLRGASAKEAEPVDAFLQILELPQIPEMLRDWPELVVPKLQEVIGEGVVASPQMVVEEITNAITAAQMLPGDPLPDLPDTTAPELPEEATDDAGEVAAPEGAGGDGESAAGERVPASGADDSAAAPKDVERLEAPGGDAGDAAAATGKGGGAVRPSSRGGNESARGEGAVEGSTAPGPGDSSGDEGGVDAGSKPKPEPKSEPPKKAEAEPKAEAPAKDAGEPETKPAAEKKPERPRYVIEDPMSLLPGEGVGDVTIARRNIEAIKRLRELIDQERQAGPEDWAVLGEWRGWGRLKSIVEPGSNKTMAELQYQLRKLIGADAWQALRRSTLDAFYTDPRVIVAMWEGLQQAGFGGGSVLEPSMGAGYFFGLMPMELRKRSSLYGVELDAMTAAIAQSLYPEAEIRNMGFEKYQVPDGSFDLAISNVPFMNVAINDSRYNKLKPQLHNYFFLKALDKVRAGGLVVFITSRYTMDNMAASSIRQALHSKSDLVTAIRLPSGGQKEISGTEVVTDLLVLRKRFPGEEAPKPGWIKSSKAGGDLGAAALNEYWAANPTHVLGRPYLGAGMYGPNELLVEPREGWHDELAALLKELPKDLYQSGGTRAPVRIAQPTQVRAGTIRKDKDGALVQDTKDGPKKLSLPQDKAQLIESYIPVRDGMRAMFKAQVDNKDSQELIDAARKSYEAFVKKHGFLHTAKNAKVLLQDVDGPSVIALEDWDAKKRKGTPSRALREPVLSPNVDPTKLTTVQDAMLYSLHQHGTVDIGEVASLLGTNVEDVESELWGSEAVFLNPATRSWEPREYYLSGTVRQKLKVAEKQAETDGRFAKNVAALKDVQPEWVTVDGIRAVRLSATWVPEQVRFAFLQEQLGIDPGTAKSHIRYIEELGRWELVKKSGLTSRRASTLETPRKNFGDVLVAALNNVKPTIVLRDEDGNKLIGLSRQATEEFHLKIDALHDMFDVWVHQSAAARDPIEEAFNYTNNDWVTPVFDGSELAFPGMDAEMKRTMRPHQRNAVLRSMLKGRIMAHHEVGTGKTRTMIAVAMERRRLTGRKSMLVFPNDRIGKTPEEVLELYPGARFVFIPPGGNKAKREELIQRAAIEDVDIIIMAHSTFDALRLSPEREAKFVQYRYNEFEQVLEAMKQAEDPPKRIVTYIEKQLEAYKQKLDKLTDARMDQVYFEELGVGSIIIDEVHAYKNMQVLTAAQNLKGIPRGANQRTENLLYKSQDLHERLGRPEGLFLFSGTPVMNQLPEIYVWHRLLQPDVLEQYGLRSFDAWRAMFGDTTTDTEVSVSGEFKEVQRFAKVVNTDVLQRLIKEMFDTVTANEVPDLVRPTPKYVTINTQITPDQQWYMSEMRDRARMLAGIKPGTPREELPPHPYEEGQVDSMGTLVQDGRKCMLDARYVYPEAEDHPESKVNMLVKQVIEDHQKFDGPAQLIFTELGDKRTSWGFRLVDDLIDKLVEAGIPREKIVDFYKLKSQSDKQKEEKNKVLDGLNNGDILVAIGSTQKLGTGINVQRRLKAMHHLDAPWRPKDLDQREGRGIRHGNMHDEVLIYRHIQSGTFDGFMYQQLEVKNRMLDELLLGEAVDTEIDYDMDNPDALDFEVLKTLAIGSEVLEAKTALRKQQKALVRKNVLQNLEVEQVARDVAGLRNDVELAKAAPYIDALKPYREYDAKTNPTKWDTLTWDVPGQTRVEPKRSSDGGVPGDVVHGMSKFGAYGGLEQARMLFGDDVYISLAWEIIGDTWSWRADLKTPDGRFPIMWQRVVSDQDYAKGDYKQARTNLAHARARLSRKVEDLVNDVRAAEARAKRLDASLAKLKELQSRDDSSAEVVKVEARMKTINYMLEHETRSPTVEVISRPWMDNDSWLPATRVILGETTGTLKQVADDRWTFDPIKGTQSEVGKDTPVTIVDEAYKLREPDFHGQEGFILWPFGPKVPRTNPAPLSSNASDAEKFEALVDLSRNPYDSPAMARARAWFMNPMRTAIERLGRGQGEVGKWIADMGYRKHFWEFPQQLRDQAIGENDRLLTAMQESREVAAARFKQVVEPLLGTKLERDTAYRMVLDVIAYKMLLHWKTNRTVEVYDPLTDTMVDQDITLPLDIDPDSVPGQLRDWELRLTPEQREVAARMGEWMDELGQILVDSGALTDDARKENYMPMHYWDIEDLRARMSKAVGLRRSKGEPSIGYARQRRGSTRPNQMHVDMLMQTDIDVRRYAEVVDYTRRLANLLHEHSVELLGYTAKDVKRWKRMSKDDWDVVRKELDDQGYVVYSAKRGVEGKKKEALSAEHLDFMAKGRIPVERREDGRALRPNPETHTYLVPSWYPKWAQSSRDLSVFGETSAFLRAAQAFITYGLKLPALRGIAGTLSPARLTRNVMSDLAIVRRSETERTSLRVANAARPGGDGWRVLMALMREDPSKLPAHLQTVYKHIRETGVARSGLVFGELGFLQAHRKFKELESIIPVKKSGVTATDVLLALRKVWTSDFAGVRYIEDVAENLVRVSYTLVKMREYMQRGMKAREAGNQAAVDLGRVLVDYRHQTHFERRYLNGLIFLFYTFPVGALKGGLGAMLGGTGGGGRTGSSGGFGQEWEDSGRFWQRAARGTTRRVINSKLLWLMLLSYNLSNDEETELRILQDPRAKHIANNWHIVLPWKTEEGYQVVLWAEDPSEADDRLMGLGGFSSALTQAVMTGEPGMLTRWASQIVDRAAKEATQMLTFKQGAGYLSQFSTAGEEMAKTARGALRAAGTTRQLLDWLEKDAGYNIVKVLPGLLAVQLDETLPATADEMREWNKAGRRRRLHTQVSAAIQRELKSFGAAYSSGNEKLQKAIVERVRGRVEKQLTEMEVEGELLQTLWVQEKLERGWWRKQENAEKQKMGF